MSDDPSVYLRPSSSREVFDQTRIFDSKKWLWVPDEEEGFKKACVKSVRGDKVLVELTGGQVYIIIIIIIIIVLLHQIAGC